MKTIYLTFLFLSSTFLLAQTNVELTPKGFSTVEIPSPAGPIENLIKASKSWASSNNAKGAEVYDVTSNSLSIDGFSENAYFYTNRGETYNFDVKYTLKVVFQKNNTTKVSFSVKEIYDHGNVLKSTIADFFKPDGKVKEDFSEAKSSLEQTATKIIRSFLNTFVD